MTWTLVQKNSANNDLAGGTLNVVLTNPVTSGNLVAITVSWADTSTATVADDKGNNYTLLDTQDETLNGQSSAAAGTVNVTNGPTTFTLSNTPNTTFRDITVEEWSTTGGPSAGLDGHHGNTTTGIALGGGFDSGNIVTTVNGDLIWSCSNSSSSSVPADSGSGFTRNSTIGGEATESQTQSAAGTIAGTWVNNAGAGFNFMANVIAFKPAVAAGGISITKQNFKVDKFKKALGLGPNAGLFQVRAFPVAAPTVSAFPTVPAGIIMIGS